MDFEAVGRKDLYCLRHSVASVKASKRTEFFGEEFSPGGSWQSLYKLPVDKMTGDLQWRIVHGGIATKVSGTPPIVDGCHFCLESETVYHLFVQCPRLDKLFRQLQRWFNSLGEGFSFSSYIIFGPYYCAVLWKAVH